MQVIISPVAIMEKEGTETPSIEEIWDSLFTPNQTPITLLNDEDSSYFQTINENKPPDFTIKCIILVQIHTQIYLS